MACVRIDSVVPFAVEFVAQEVDGFDFGVGDFASRRVAVGVEFAADFQAHRSCGRGDRLDDGLVADQRFAAPVAGIMISIYSIT